MNFYIPQLTDKTEDLCFRNVIDQNEKGNWRLMPLISIEALPDEQFGKMKFSFVTLEQKFKETVMQIQEIVEESYSNYAYVPFGNSFKASSAILEPELSEWKVKDVGKASFTLSVYLNHKDKKYGIFIKKMALAKMG